jgi:HEAT repeat protein
MDDEDYTEELFALAGEFFIPDGLNEEELANFLAERDQFVANLRETGDDTAIETLFRVLVFESDAQNDSTETFDYICGVFKEIGSKATRYLIKKLEDEPVASTAAFALGQIGDAEAVEPLIEALNSEDYDTQVRAAQALGYLGDSRAIEPLAQLYESKDKLSYGVEQRVREALVRLGAIQEFAN